MSAVVVLLWIALVAVYAVFEDALPRWGKLGLGAVALLGGYWFLGGSYVLNRS